MRLCRTENGQVRGRLGRFLYYNTSMIDYLRLSTPLNLGTYRDQDRPTTCYVTSWVRIAGVRGEREAAATAMLKVQPHDTNC